MSVSGGYSPDADSAGRRSLRNVALDLMAAGGAAEAMARAARQYDAADNMTDRMAALATLSLHDGAERDRALADFYQRYAADALVIDKWFSLQAMTPQPGTLENVRALTGHPAFSIRQSQPCARGDRRLRARQPDPVQPRRRRRLHIRRRPRAQRSIRKIRNWRRGWPPPSAVGACWKPAAAPRRKTRLSASSARRAFPATSPTSSNARSAPVKAAAPAHFERGRFNGTASPSAARIRA